MLNRRMAAWGGLALAAKLAAQTNVLPPGGIFGFGVYGAITSARVSVVGEPFSQALQLANAVRPANPWNYILVAPTVAAVAAGDVLAGEIWVRNLDPAAPGAAVQLNFEDTGPAYAKSISRTMIGDGLGWTRQRFAFTAAAGYPAGKAQCSLYFGYAPQSVQLGGLALANFGKSKPLGAFTNDIVYLGRDPAAAWRAPAAERIAAHRQAALTVSLTDAEGYPAPGATVRVEMRRHAFGFGSAVDASRLMGRSGAAADRGRYQAVITNWFNKAVLENDLKWVNWESAPGNPALALSAVDWLAQRGLAVRGHNLIWPGTNQAYFLPPDVPALFSNPTALRSRIDRHFTNIITATRGRLAEWDVVNEPYAEHAVMDVLGPGEMARWFQIARAVDPGPTLFVNEYNNLEAAGLGLAQTDDFFGKLAALQAAGAPLGGAGFQSHFSSYLSPLDQVVAMLDRFSALGVPLEVTELDVNTPDESAQADYLGDFMTAAFSHPAVHGIVMWGFWEGQHWIPPAALFRLNWEMKPAAVRWSNLVFHTWWTSTNAVSGAGGDASVRAFKGDYDLSVTLPGRTDIAWSGRVTLTNDLAVTVRVPVTPPALSAIGSKGGVLLRWPGATLAPGYRLETSSGPSGAPWLPVSGAGVDGTDAVAWVAPRPSASFFRLARPPSGP